jgi:hypothetical protein
MEEEMRVFIFNQKSQILEIFSRSIALPLYYELREEDIDVATSTLEKAMEELK